MRREGNVGPEEEGKGKRKGKVKRRKKITKARKLDEKRRRKRGEKGGGNGDG